MLGRTAGEVFWMFRYLERSEYNARLVDAGFRIALTRSDAAADEWASLATTSGIRTQYLEKHDGFDGPSVVNYLLRDPSNPSSVISMVRSARENARHVRSSLTREVWEAINNCWMTLQGQLARQIRDRELPEVLDVIRKQSAQVRGALHGTMLRNDIYNFARLGTFLERADNTARILDVKYYVLLPSASFVGTSLDNVQWETILRSVSAMRSYRWLKKGDVTPLGIADFLIMDRRLPRSLAFCHEKIVDNLGHLERDYGITLPSHQLAADIRRQFQGQTIDTVFEIGLHEFLGRFQRENAELGNQIERDYRFYS